MQPITKLELGEVAVVSGMEGEPAQECPTGPLLGYPYPSLANRS